jgi:hypothetical protein
MNFQFRKRFGDGEFALGNNFNNAESMKKGKKENKGKKVKVQKDGEKSATNEPVLPKFVPKSNNTST